MSGEGKRKCCCVAECFYVATRCLSENVVCPDELAVPCSFVDSHVPIDATIFFKCAAAGNCCYFVSTGSSQIDDAAGLIVCTPDEEFIDCNACIRGLSCCFNPGPICPGTVNLATNFTITHLASGDTCNVVFSVALPQGNDTFTFKCRYILSSIPPGNCADVRPQLFCASAGFFGNPPGWYSAIVVTPGPGVASATVSFRREFGGPCPPSGTWEFFAPASSIGFSYGNPTVEVG